jgi:integrase
VPRDKKGRNANGRSSIFQSPTDGTWHGWVSVGAKDDGRPDRRHVRGRTKAEVTRKVNLLERERDEGKTRKAGQTWTVEQWLNHWLEAIIAPPTITENAYDAYEVAVRVHLIPGLGGHRIDRLEPEHLERLYRKLVAAGAKPGRAHQVHRTMRAALGEAERRGHITTNPAALARGPKVEDEEIEAYSVAEVQRILDAAGTSRNSARWAVALALGLRQGEALGLTWADVNLDAGTLVVRRNRLRPKWRHGCGNTCGRKQAGYCPSRIAARTDTAGTKSRAGRRGMGLPDPLIALLREHQARQDADRRAACDLWQETGYVFTTAVGLPINPSTDYHAWKRLLAKAGVAERRLHAARHTAATVLLLLGVPERTVMSVMGWSSTAMAARYQHVVDEVRRGVADQVGGLLWSPPLSGTANDGAAGGERPPPAA